MTPPRSSRSRIDSSEQATPRKNSSSPHGSSDSPWRRAIAIATATPRCAWSHSSARHATAGSATPDELRRDENRPGADALGDGGAELAAATELLSAATGCELLGPASELGPAAELLAAAAELSAAEQQEMIRAMVASLEARLLDDPNDVAGWQRLIESRRVLNDRDGLIRALAGAASAFPRDKASQLALLETLLQVDTPLSYRDATRLALSNLRAIDANGLEYLFFNGHFANLRGDTDIALSSWMALQAQLPEDDAFSKRLAAQINALQSE